MRHKAEPDMGAEKGWLSWPVALRSGSMIRHALLLASLLSTATFAATPPPTAPTPLFTGADLFGLEAAADPQISPDGSKIVYVRKTNDIMIDRARSTLWLIDVKTGAQVPLVAGASSPRWSPDGTRIAYVMGGEGGAQIHVRWIASGNSARITSLPEAPSSLSWSRDGTRLAYIAHVREPGATIGQAPPKPDGAQWAPPLEAIDTLVYRGDEGGLAVPGRDHVFVVPADGGAPRQLTFGAFDDEGPLSWDANDRAVLFASSRTGDVERTPNSSGIYAADVTTGALARLTTRAGPDQNPVVSSDGKLVAYLGFDDRLLGDQNVQLSVMDRDGKHARVLTAGLDRTVAAPIWATDGRSVYVKYDDRGMTKVARVGLDGRVTDITTGLVQSVFDRPYTGGSFSVAKDGAIAFTGGSASRPADVMLARGSATPRRLTSLNEAALAGKTLAQVRPLAVSSSFDKLPIQAWMVTPPGFDPARKYPMILEIHGGPFAAYGPSFSTDDQLYAAAGYVVVYANPRGSTSYGEAFANQIHHSYPAHDYDDLMSVVDAAIAGGSVDPNRLFVTGGSGGGLLTSWIVGKTDRFRAAAAQKPVIDWASFVLTADQTSYFSRYWFGKFPWEDPQGYWARSPLSLAGNVKTPTLVVVGSQDFRTPVTEAEQFYTALKLRGVPTELVKVPGANHEDLAARPSQSAAKASAILAWFARYGGEPVQ
jgi:dipeptidyl aminopeptidase/acylaminoacyl peptidase